VTRRPQTPEETQMIRLAALVPMLFFACLGAAARADCPPGSTVCPETRPALEKEAGRLAGLAATGAGKKSVAAGEAAFRKTLAACGGAWPCLQRNLIDHIFELRQGSAAARSKDAEGISIGPLVGNCPGLGALVSVVFVNSAPAFVILVWRDHTVVLTQALSGSGARYTGPFGMGEAQFWNKGDEATLDLPGKPSLACRIEQGG
jgi:hypothetical protein